MIPYGRQEVTEEDIRAVEKVLRSAFLTQGPEVPLFEEALASRVQASHAVAVSSATSALHVACLALGVGPGDVVWTSPITFVASANCALYCGAEVDFVDVHPETGNLSVEALRTKLESAREANRLPKVLIPVHLTGRSCDMAAIGALAKEYGVRVLEDASHAIGARHGGEPVGTCRHSDITVFSFHPVKIVTTGEGGAAVTNDPALATEMEELRTHGITRDEERMSRPSEGPWYYEQLRLGYNYRMTDLQAALGRSQIERLEGYVQLRNEIACRYDVALDAPGVGRPPPVPHGDLSAFHLYVIRVRDRLRVFNELRRRGIGVNVHYIPVPSQPFYRGRGFSPDAWPGAMEFYEGAISLPMYPTLSEEDQSRVVEAVVEAVRP